MAESTCKKEKVKKFRIRSKSYFNKYFVSFMMILFVPMLTIVLVFWQTNSIVREQIVNSSQNTLKQFFGRMDAVGESSIEMCTAISNSNECRTYSECAVNRPRDTSYPSWELHNLLDDYVGERYSDVFVYFVGNEHIVSGVNMTMEAKEYYDTNYGKHADYWEEFEDILENATGLPRYYSMNGNGIDSYLCVAMRQNMYKSHRYDYIVVGVLKPDYIEGLFEEAENVSQNGISMIFDSGKNLLISSSELVKPEKLGGDVKQNTSYEEMIDGEKYIMQVQKSDKLKSYYAYAVSYKYFWEQLYQVYIICGLGGLGSILLGILLALRETRKNYEPIGQMVTNLQMQEEGFYDARINTEFEYIDSLLQNWKEDKFQLHQSVRKIEEMKRNRFLISLLEGSMEIEQYEGNVFQNNGITLYSDLFQAGILQVEENGGLKQDEISFVLANVFQELCDRQNRGYVLHIRGNKYAVLFNLNTSSEKNDFLQIFEEGRVFLEQYVSIKVTLALSSVQEGVVGIRMAYEEALFALRYRFLMGKESIIEYSKVAGRNFKHFTAAESKMMRMIKAYLKQSEKDFTAEQLVAKILRDYEINESASMETMECFKMETVGTLNMLLIQNGYLGEKWKNDVMKLFKEATLEAFVSAFEVLMTELCENYQEQSENEDICRKAQKYIQQNFTDVNLSLNLLSEVLKISPSYLSRLFKEKYQVSIPNYVTSLRMDSAKKELRSTSHSIFEVAQNNGFVDDKAFIKVFKKVEGITPGAYRKMGDE